MSITKKVCIGYALVVGILASSVSALATTPLSAGVLTGYYKGMGIMAQSTVSPGLPGYIRIASGYTTLDPGKEDRVSRIYGQGTASGQSDKSGSIWDVRVDYLYPLNWPEPMQTRLFAGFRYASYSGLFMYDTEQLEVTTQVQGWGFGFEIGYPLSSRWEVVIQNGWDFYSAPTLSSGQVVYSPGGGQENASGGFTYKEANDAIFQPRFEIRWMVGVNMRLGR